VGASAVSVLLRGYIVVFVVWRRCSASSALGLDWGGELVIVIVELGRSDCVLEE
jgi:hypothetical protein